MTVTACSSTASCPDSSGCWHCGSTLGVCWAACSHTVACHLEINAPALTGSHAVYIMCYAMHSLQHNAIWPSCSSCRQTWRLTCLQSHWPALNADECNENNVSHLLGTVREMLHQLSSAALPLTESVAPGEVAAEQKERTSMAQAGAAPVGGAMLSPAVSGSAQGDAEMQVRGDPAYLRE